jgi:hypothetical protein
MVEAAQQRKAFRWVPSSGSFSSLVRCAFFRQKFALKDAIGSHACSLAASMHVTNAFFSGVHSSYRLAL